MTNILAIINLVFTTFTVIPATILFIATVRERQLVPKIRNDHELALVNQALIFIFAMVVSVGLLNTTIFYLGYIFPVLRSNQELVLYTMENLIVMSGTWVIYYVRNRLTKATR